MAAQWFIASITVSVRVKSKSLNTRLMCDMVLNSFARLVISTLYLIATWLRQHLRQESGRYTIVYCHWYMWCAHILSTSPHCDEVNFQHNVEAGMWSCLLVAQSAALLLLAGAKCSLITWGNTFHLYLYTE